MSIKNTLRGYLADTARAFDRSPVEGVLAFVTAVVFSYHIEAGQDMEQAFQFAEGAFLVGAAAWAATLLHALHALTERQRWALTLAGTVVGAAYLLLVPDMDLESESWRGLALVVAAALLLFSAPGWIAEGGEPSLRLRRVNARFVLRAIGIGLYGLALFAGLALALLAIDKLFELDLEHTLYGHEFVWIMLVLVPWVIVGGLDDYVRPLDQQTDVERVVYRLATFLVSPLVALYYLILCVYAIRIAITGELPHNLVSPMVIAAGVLAAIALILFDPRADSATGTRWVRYTALVFLPLAPLGIWALYARVDAYGWTEFRLLRVIVVLTLFGLAVLGSVQVLRRRPISLRVIPFVLGVVLLLSAVGPWGFVAVSRRDQQQRLLNALEKARVNVASAPAPGDTTRRIVAGNAYRDINSTASYLHSHFGEQALAMLPLRARRAAATYALADYYHLGPARTDSVTYMRSGRLAAGVAVPLSNGEVAYRIEVEGNGVKRSWARRDTLFTIVNGDTLRALLAPTIAAGGERRVKMPDLPPALATLTARDQTGRVRGTIIIFDLMARQVRDSTTIVNLQALLLLRSSRE